MQLDMLIRFQFSLLNYGTGNENIINYSSETDC